MRGQHKFSEHLTHAWLHSYKPKHMHGLTLIELVVVCAIIAVLVGIVWVVMAPAREKARQVRCMSNLKQVWMALESYRNDHDGVDPNGIPLEYWELGLPDSVSVLVETGYIPVEVARCPDDLALHLGHDPLVPEVLIHPTFYVSFSRGWWDEREPVIAKRKGIKFRAWVAKHGTQIAVILDWHHNRWYSNDPLDECRFTLWATLSGNVRKGWYDMPGECSPKEGR